MAGGFTARNTAHSQERVVSMKRRETMCAIGRIFVSWASNAHSLVFHTLDTDGWMFVLLEVAVDLYIQHVS